MLEVLKVPQHRSMRRWKVCAAFLRHKGILRNYYFLDKTNFGFEPGREVLYMWDRVSVGGGGAGFWHHGQGQGPGAVRPADDTESLHVVKLSPSDSKLCRIEASGPSMDRQAHLRYMMLHPVLGIVRPGNSPS